MTVIHNRGKVIGDKTIARKLIIPKAWDEKGQPLRDPKNEKIIPVLEIEPGKSVDVTDDQLEHLMKLFPSEIVNIEDIKNMQQQFAVKPGNKEQRGYLSPEEVEEKVAARVAQELKKREADKKDAGAETRDQLIARIDGMDRPDLIAFIEQEGLSIEHKNFKAPNSLKAAILTALENKKASESEAA